MAAGRRHGSSVHVAGGSGRPAADAPLGGGTTAAAGRPTSAASVALAVMARRPALGRVKTRLAAEVGAERALSLYEELLAGTLDTLEQTLGSASASVTGRFLAVAPDDAGMADLPSRGDSWLLLWQQGNGLGQRLGDVFSQLFDRGYGAVVIVGSDSPALPSAYVSQAARLLTTGGVRGGRTGPSKIVFGPALDGGYYLIGLRRRLWEEGRASVEDLLDSTPMGTPQALSFSLARAKAEGWRPALLPLWLDVDRAGDVALASRLREHPDQPARGGSDPSLQEVYLHLTNRCSTGCRHCYAPGPGDDTGELSTDAWLGIVGEARELGATGFTFIGGDPFLRTDLLDLVRETTRSSEAQARLFFNREVAPALAEELADAGRGRLTPLLSLDGPEAVNDSLRGRGNFHRGLCAAQALLAVGLRPVVNTVLLRPVLPALPALLRDMADAGLDRLHLILPHERGGLVRRGGLMPSGPEMEEALRVAIAEAAAAGIVIDNLAGWKARFGARRDLCSAGCSLVTVGPDGSAYACPITCEDPAFFLGDVGEQGLAEIWRDSPGLRLLRHLHARDRAACASCAVVDACGGECWVQAYDHSRVEGREADPRADFPYCGVVRPRLQAAAAELDRESPRRPPDDAGLHAFSCI